MKTIYLVLSLLLLANAAFCQKTEVRYDNWPTTVNSNAEGIIIKQQGGDQSKFVLSGGMWDHRIITYFFQNGTNDMAGNTERDAVRAGFALWEGPISNIRFLEVCNAGNADIVISWATFNHGDPNPAPLPPGFTEFDGVGTTLAHAFAPPPNALFGPVLAGDIHFDDSETWVNAIRGNANQPIDLVTVAAHEVGHSLGLAHTTVSGSIMLENYTQSHRFFRLRRYCWNTQYIRYSAQ